MVVAASADAVPFRDWSRRRCGPRTGDPEDAWRGRHQEPIPSSELRRTTGLDANDLAAGDSGAHA